MTLRRVQAFLAIAAFVCAQLVSLHHLATTTHERCADHGELVESGPAPARGAAASALAPAAPAAGHHAHCLFDALFHQAATGRAGVVVATVATPAVAAAADPPVAAPPRATVYRFAPKTSPPARATA